MDLVRQSKLVEDFAVVSMVLRGASSFLDRDLSAASPAKIGAALELLQATDAKAEAL